MARLNRSEHYSAVAIAFHWTIAVLAIANLGIGLLRGPLPILRGFMPAHKAIGLTILVLTLARLAWRVAHRAPPAPRDIPRWQQQAARATHWALYLLLVALPLSGWVMSSAPEGRRPLTWFGLFDLPYLPASAQAAAGAHAAHGLLGWAMLLLAALHVAAALRHHFLLRDGVLARMIPSIADR